MLNFCPQHPYLLPHFLLNEVWLGKETLGVSSAAAGWVCADKSIMDTGGRLHQQLLGGMEQRAGESMAREEGAKIHPWKVREYNIGGHLGASA